jgi:cytochrome c6
LRCASCHGEDGKLGIAGAKDLSISKLTNSEITSIIYNGKNGMPSFGGAFTEEQLKALVPIVKSLRK